MDTVHQYTASSCSQVDYCLTNLYYWYYSPFMKYHNTNKQQIKNSTKKIITFNNQTNIEINKNIMNQNKI